MQSIFLHFLILPFTFKSLLKNAKTKKRKEEFFFSLIYKVQDILDGTVINTSILD